MSSIIKVLPEEILLRFLLTLENSGMEKVAMLEILPKRRRVSQHLQPGH